MRRGSIRTPDQRLRVFVSSTLAELAEERAAVREVIERLQLRPVLFELGAPRPHPPRDLYRAYLEQSQIFVGIYWQRYGWVAPGETVSGLEDEYHLSVGMPRLRRSGSLQQLLQESGPLVTSGNDLWGRAHILTLQGYEAFRALDLDLAKQLHSTAHGLAVELGDRAAQAENLLALGHIHLVREDNENAARVLAEARMLVEQLDDPHDLGHVDQGLALLTVSRGELETGQALLHDVSRRFLDLEKARDGNRLHAWHG